MKNQKKYIIPNLKSSPIVIIRLQEITWTRATLAFCREQATDYWIVFV